LLDRFDLRVLVSKPDVSELLGGERGEPSADVAARVALARGERANAAFSTTRNCPRGDSMKSRR
jgi:predicted ATPase with chaperone activity